MYTVLEVALTLRMDGPKWLMSGLSSCRVVNIRPKQEELNGGKEGSKLSDLMMDMECRQAF